MFVLLTTINTTAQTTADTGAVLKNNGSLVSYTNYINWSLSYGTYNMRFKLSDNSGQKFIFSPNEIYQTKIGFAYSFIDFSYAFSAKILPINNDPDIKGTTKRNDIGFVFRFGNFYVRAERADEKGFYLWNTKDFYPEWQPGDAYVQFPNLHVVQTGVSISFNTNPKFSVSSLAGGTEQQLKTSFTLLPSLFAYVYKISDDDTAVTKGQNDYTTSTDLSAGLIAAVNKVFAKNWYISASAGPTIGVNYVSSSLVDSNLITTKQKQNFVSLGYNTRLAIGWSNRKFFAGIDGSLREYSHTDSDKILFQKQFYDITLYAGMRLAPPRFVKNSISWVKKIIPL